MRYSQKNKRKILYLYIGGSVLLFAALVFGVALGSSKIGFADIFKAIFGIESDSVNARIVRYARLPRVLGAIVSGAALATSGAIIQNVLSNRLASPSIIGVNSGAGLAVTVSAALGIFGGWRVSLFAFLGAFATVMLVSLGAKKWGASRGTVILIGVAMNSLLGAVSDCVITFSPDVSIMTADFKVGDFSSVTYVKLIPAAVIVLVSIAILMTLSNELDVLTLGEDNARGLGMNTNLMRVVFLLLSALLAGAAVSVCGLLSFVGLLVPHAVRRTAGGSAKHLVPLSAIFGAGFVSLCDTLSRVIFAPYEIPVGIILAFLGAPFFIFILIYGKGGRTND